LAKNGEKIMQRWMVSSGKEGGRQAQFSRKTFRIDAAAVVGTY
jgi:hypothetical protein